MSVVERIREFLGRFRRSKWYMDVVWQDLGIKKLRPKLTEELVDMTREELRELMLGWGFMVTPRYRISVDTMLDENDFNEVKLRLLDLFLGKRPIVKRFQAVLNLRGVGPYIASQLLSAVDDQFIIYEEEVLYEGIKALLQDWVGWIDLPDRVGNDAEEYLRLNEACKAIRDWFGFKSLGEVHEFFWHGYKSPPDGLGLWR